MEPSRRVPCNSTFNATHREEFEFSDLKFYPFHAKCRKAHITARHIKDYMLKMIGERYRSSKPRPVALRAERDFRRRKPTPISIRLKVT